MAEYKCIYCGAIKDSDEPCICSVCGYKMFETPYDQCEMLRKEIIGFIAHFKLDDFQLNTIDLYRNVQKKQKGGSDKNKTIKKDEDDKRFPGFNAIQKYVCSSERLELFCERLKQSVDEIRNHIHQYYQQEYIASPEKLIQSVKERDAALNNILQILRVNCVLPELVIPDIKVRYSETPDDVLVDIADSLLDDIQAMSEKIRVFVRQNNIYGTAYREIPKRAFKNTNTHDYKKELDYYKQKLEKELNKKSVVDIFSDGSDELKGMLSVLWGTMEALLTYPVLVKKYEYIFPDGIIADDGKGKSIIQGNINKHFSALDEIIYAYDFLENKSAIELFDLYDKMINLDTEGYFGLTRSKLLKIGESEKKLNEMIGLRGIKESIKKIKAYALANKDSKDLNIHMCFLGNPGSGKTEVARYIAGILYENGILPTKKIVEVDRSGLVSQYFGATAEKTTEVINSAMGGVLFIDEAYALGNNSDAGITDYGREAIDTLVKAMEDKRGKFCVILAGYKNEMLKMLSTNPGFKSRIQFTLDFPNYSRNELRSIAESMLGNRGYIMGDEAMNRLLDITDVKRKEPNFANAREIRNLLDQVIMCQNVRCMGTNDKTLGLIDVNKYIKDSKINIPTDGSSFKAAILSGEEELERLIGLDSVKRMVKKIKAYAKRNKGSSDFNLHMCFYGNPGTGKTEVARILSRILYDAGVLDEAKLIETDGQGLIGKYVGESGAKTVSKINDAMNGVLFIDEAYSLVGNNTTGGSAYGDEAIAALLKGMEDHRGRFCVILAGYRDEMNYLLSSNPGFDSRIQFKLEFPDYSREELGQIAKVFLHKKHYQIDSDALEMVLDIAEYYRVLPNFANARTLRNILEQVLLNQNLRTDESMDDNTVILEDVRDYLSDEGIDLSAPQREVRRIGFN